jgi:hypothetical protein
MCTDIVFFSYDFALYQFPGDILQKEHCYPWRGGGISGTAKKILHVQEEYKKQRQKAYSYNLHM